MADNHESVNGNDPNKENQENGSAFNSEELLQDIMEEIEHEIEADLKVEDNLIDETELDKAIDVYKGKDKLVEGEDTAREEIFKKTSDDIIFDFNDENWLEENLLIEDETLKSLSDEEIDKILDQAETIPSLKESDPAVAEKLKDFDKSFELEQEIDDQDFLYEEEVEYETYQGDKEPISTTKQKTVEDKLKTQQKVKNELQKEETLPDNQEKQAKEKESVESKQQDMDSITPDDIEKKSLNEDIDSPDQTKSETTEEEDSKKNDRDDTSSMIQPMPLNSNNVKKESNTMEMNSQDQPVFESYNQETPKEIPQMKQPPLTKKHFEHMQDSIILTTGYELQEELYLKSPPLIEENLVETVEAEQSQVLEFFNEEEEASRKETAKKETQQTESDGITLEEETIEQSADQVPLSYEDDLEQELTQRIEDLKGQGIDLEEAELIASEEQIIGSDLPQKDVTQDQLDATEEDLILDQLDLEITGEHTLDEEIEFEEINKMPEETDHLEGVQGYSFEETLQKVFEKESSETPALIEEEVEKIEEQQEPSLSRRESISESIEREMARPIKSVSLDINFVFDEEEEEEDGQFIELEVSPAKVKEPIKEIGQVQPEKESFKLVEEEMVTEEFDTNLLLTQEQELEPLSTRLEEVEEPKELETEPEPEKYSATGIADRKKATDDGLDKYRMLEIQEDIIITEAEIILDYESPYRESEETSEEIDKKLEIVEKSLEEAEMEEAINVTIDDVADELNKINQMIDNVDDIVDQTVEEHYVKESDEDYNRIDKMIEGIPNIVDQTVDQIKELEETWSSDKEIADQQAKKDFEKIKQQAKVSDNELKEMLVYLDSLLGELPVNKIKEFAESKYYHLYNKLFDEMGI